MHKQISNVDVLTFSSYRKTCFMLDPNFPERLLKAGNERTIEFIQSLSTEYSKRGLTEKTDTCAAISGLESRIAQTKKCKTRFGIFSHFSTDLCYGRDRKSGIRIESTMEPRSFRLGHGWLTAVVFNSWILLSAM
jgi:hypothetical protein